MTTSRFTGLVGVGERSYRPWQARQRQGRRAKGPWPTPSADRIEPTAIRLRRPVPAVGLADDLDADAPRWVARARLDRLPGAENAPAACSRSTIRPSGACTRRRGGRRSWWRRRRPVRDTDGRDVADRRDRRTTGSKLELGWHGSPTANHRDAIQTVELALAEKRNELLGKTLPEAPPIGSAAGVGLDQLRVGVDEGGKTRRRA